MPASVLPPRCNIFFINPLDDFSPPLLLPGSAPECAAAAQPALRLPVSHNTTSSRSLPLYSQCFAIGVFGWSDSRNCWVRQLFAR